MGISMSQSQEIRILEQRAEKCKAGLANNLHHSSVLQNRPIPQKEVHIFNKKVKEKQVITSPQLNHSYQQPKVSQNRTIIYELESNLQQLKGRAKQVPLAKQNKQPKQNGSMLTVNRLKTENNQVKNAPTQRSRKVKIGKR